MFWSRSVSVAMSDEAKQIMSWRAHPARERRAHAVGAGVAILALSLATFAMFVHFAWAPLAAGLLVVSLNRFFFPSSFTIDEEGITAQYPLRRLRLRWIDVRRFVHDRNGGYLSTRARPSRLDAYRGMHLLFGEQREAIVQCIQGLVARGEAA